MCDFRRGGYLCRAGSLFVLRAVKSPVAEFLHSSPLEPTVLFTQKVFYSCIRDVCKKYNIKSQCK